MPEVAFLAASTPVIDSNLVGELLDLVMDCASLFSVYPINIYMIASLGRMALGLFRKAKKVAVA